MVLKKCARYRRAGAAPGASGSPGNGEEADVMSSATAGRVPSRRQVRRVVANLDRTFRRYDGPLVERFGEEQATIMRAEMLEECRQLVPDVPYIGGRRSAYTPLLMSNGPQALAVYRVVLRHGGTAQDVGWMFHHMARASFGRIPRMVRHWMGRHLYFNMTRRKVMKYARWSQERRYPDDTVIAWVDGDGRTFDWGLDISGCSIVKYHNAHGTDELVPYLCEIDYVLAEMMGYELRRTKTCAWGCDKCDFRFVLGRSTTAPWPPAFAERSCGRADTTQPGSATAQ